MAGPNGLCLGLVLAPDWCPRERLAVAYGGEQLFVLCGDQFPREPFANSVTGSLTETFGQVRLRFQLLHLGGEVPGISLEQKSIPTLVQNFGVERGIEGKDGVAATEGLQ